MVSQIIPLLTPPTRNRCTRKKHINVCAYFPLLYQSDQLKKNYNPKEFKTSPKWVDIILRHINLGFPFQTVIVPKNMNHQSLFVKRSLEGSTAVIEVLLQSSDQAAQY